MKSNELLEKIHSGEIKDNAKIEVLTEEREHIAFIEYKDKKLNWTSGNFDTRYLCDIETEFEIVENEWEIKRLDTKSMYTRERINAIEDKVNEIIDTLNKINEPLPF